MKLAKNFQCKNGFLKAELKDRNGNWKKA